MLTFLEHPKGWGLSEGVWAWYGVGETRGFLLGGTNGGWTGLKMQDVGGTAVAITDESHCLHSYLLAKVDTDELRTSLLIGQWRLLLTITRLTDEKNYNRMRTTSEPKQHFFVCVCEESCSQVYMKSLYRTQFETNVCSKNIYFHLEFELCNHYEENRKRMPMSALKHESCLCTHIKVLK